MALLMIALKSPGIGTTVYLNCMALLWFGLAALFLFNKAIQAHQLLRRGSRS